MSFQLLLVGCGNMGRALLAGWHEVGLMGRSYVVEPAPVTVMEGVTFVADLADLPPDYRPDMIVLAIKPQILPDVLPEYRRFAGLAPFLSIAAGKTLAFFECQLGREAAIVRAMPNLPAMVRRGSSAACANAQATPQHRDVADALLRAVGSVHWVEEGEIDAITALAGSGPAYVFLMAEILARAGETLGISAALSAELAREMLAGSAEMLRQSPDVAATLRARVTSKGGTTEAALRILMENDALVSIYARAMQAAVTRARELAD